MRHLRDYAVALLLALAIILIYAQTARHQFVNLDDDEYVYDNPNIRDGLTPKTIVWCFTAFYADNWHPLTWLSHALDVQLFGLWAGGHHITSVVLQIAVAVSLYFLLKRLTGRPWVAAFTTVLFAVHPLRVESVAWVSERKDLLSGLFFMLTLHAWLSYVKSPKPSAYAIALALYAVGLLCKPMLVTLPVVLLMLDYWPLGRWSVVGGRWSDSSGWRSVVGGRKRQDEKRPEAGMLLPTTGHRPPATVLATTVFLLLEKLPFFALAAGSSLITLHAQQQAMAEFALPYRLSNALVTTAAYLGQEIWPTRLTSYYDMQPNGPQPVQVLTAVLVLGMITGAAVMFRFRHRYIVVGWLWYLVMLLPVIGLVQVGGQSGADRYTYLPLIGPTLAIVLWLADDGWRLIGRPNKVVYFVLSLMLALFIEIAWLQASVWKSSISLWTHALHARGESYFVLNNLGTAVFQSGQKQESVRYFRRAVELRPDYPSTLANLGGALSELGQQNEAIVLLRKALRCQTQPDPVRDAKIHLRLARALGRNQRLDEAAQECQKTIDLDPNLTEAQQNLANLLARQGRFLEALPHFQAAIASDRSAENLAALANTLLKLGRATEAFELLNEAISLNPSLAEAQFNLALLLAGSNRRPEAIDHLQRAIAADPSSAPTQNALAALLAGEGKLADALIHFQKAVEIDPKNVLARANFGRTLSHLGNHAAAIEQLRAAMEIDPQQPQVATWLAWTLATASEGSLRNGQEALKLAEKAVADTQSRDPGALDALAAAQAELGQFSAAVRTAQQAQQLALSQGNQALAAEIAQRIDLYRVKKPFRR